MAIYSKLSNIRKLTNSSLGSIVEVSNLNFNDLSLALLEFLNNVSYNEKTNVIEDIDGINVKQINVKNNFSLKLNGATTFNIDSQGRAEGNSFLVEIAEAKRYRHTDFINWPDVGIPGEIIYTGIQNQKPAFGEDFIGYLDGKGWVSLTGEGGASYALTLLQNTGSPGLPPTPSTGSGIVWIGDPGLATTYTPTTQDLYFTDESGEIFKLTCCDGSGGGGSVTTKDMLWGLITNFAVGSVPEYVDWAGTLSPTGTHNSVLPIPFDLKIKGIVLKYLDTTAASVDALFDYDVSIGKLIDPNGVADDTNYVDLVGGSNVLTLNTANVDGNHFLIETSGLDIDVSSGDILVVKGTVLAGSSTGGSNEEIMVSLEYEKTYSGGGGGSTENVSYVEITNFNANITKTITHGLGTNAVVVDLIDTVTGDRIDGDIDAYGVNSIDITFTQTLSSVRIVVVSAGGSIISPSATYTYNSADILANNTVDLLPAPLSNEYYEFEITWEYHFGTTAYIVGGGIGAGGFQVPSSQQVFVSGIMSSGGADAIVGYATGTNNLGSALQFQMWPGTACTGGDGQLVIKISYNTITF
jgi:hypothetical protein